MSPSSDLDVLVCSILVVGLEFCDVVFVVGVDLSICDVAGGVVMVMLCAIISLGSVT